MKRRLCLGCRLFSGDVSEKEGEVCEQLGVEKRVVVSISVVPVVSRVGSNYHRSLDRIVSEFTRRCELVSRRRLMFHVPELPQNLNDARLRKTLRRVERRKLRRNASRQTEYSDLSDQEPAPKCGSSANDVRAHQYAPTSNQHRSICTHRLHPERFDRFGKHYRQIIHQGYED